MSHKNQKEELKEWTLKFIKNRDLLQNLIKNIESDENFDIIANKIDCNTHYKIIPELTKTEEITEKAKDKKLNIITLNTKKNLEFLQNNWKEFTTFPELSFYFINPKSTEEQKWIIYPRSHNLITETKHIKKSLNVLYSTVPAYK